MLESINKDNFNQVLARFSTSELEGLLQKFPYFQQAHLLLAKKYQDQNDPRFDQQLQLAALYTHDRDLFYSVFNPKSIAAPLATKPVDTVETEQHKLPEIPTSDYQKTAKELEIDVTPVVDDTVIAETHAFELSPNTDIEQQVEEQTTVTDAVVDAAVQHNSVVDKTEEEEFAEDTAPIVITEEVAEIAERETVLAETEPEIQPDNETVAIEAVEEQFNATEPHTFDEWLKAFSKQEPVKVMPAVAELQHEEIPLEPEKQDEELEKLYVANIPVNLHELVEEETNYSKGLDKFIEEQRRKHRAQVLKTQVSENDLDPELITETMARVYEMQKKYSRAIRCYEVLALKYPEKNDFFAARINYLKNIT